MDYMKLATEATIEGMNKGWGGPFGATIVRNGEVVAAVSNTMMKDTDPSAHAEMIAIRVACEKLQTMDLSDCIIYATCEPCPMCVGAIIWAGVKEVHYCNTKEDAAENGFSDMHLRDYLEGKDKSGLNMIKVDEREDCDHLWEHFKELNQSK